MRVQRVSLLSLLLLVTSVFVTFMSIVHSAKTELNFIFNGMISSSGNWWLSWSTWLWDYALQTFGDNRVGQALKLVDCSSPSTYWMTLKVGSGPSWSISKASAQCMLTDCVPRNGLGCISRLCCWHLDLGRRSQQPILEFLRFKGKPSYQHLILITSSLDSSNIFTWIHT